MVVQINQDAGGQQEPAADYYDAKSQSLRSRTKRQSEVASLSINSGNEAQTHFISSFPIRTENTQTEQQN